MTIRIITADCRDVLRSLPDESVHCCVTSPPYWGLGSYGIGTDKGEIGLEPSFTDYIETMRVVFAEVRRVLRRDGTLWLNLGDCYAGGGRGGGNGHDKQSTNVGSLLDGLPLNAFSGAKAKDLLGMPWRLAFALQADGWYLRSDIIWSKPNPMPESVTDRPTKAHEYLFLMTKSERYFYDAEAIKEPATPQDRTGIVGYATPKHLETFEQGRRYRGGGDKSTLNAANSDRRNRRTVWEIATSPFPEAHFATFPPALVEPCIKAGTSEKGCCAKCGKPWVRESSKEFMLDHAVAVGPRHHSADDNDQGANRYKDGHQPGRYHTETTGWSPSCSCLWGNEKLSQQIAGSVSCTVLDPFGGAGTTGLVADRLGRNAILIELNPQYAEMAERRIKGDAGLFAQMAAE